MMNFMTSESNHQEGQIKENVVIVGVGVNEKCVNIFWKLLKRRCHSRGVLLQAAILYKNGHETNRILECCLDYNVLMTNEMHNSYNQIYSTVFCLLYMFRTNLVVHHQQHGIIYCITQFGTIVQAQVLPTTSQELDSPDSTIVPNCVIQYIILCS